MPLKDTIRSFKEILGGMHDSLPESAFYMVRCPMSFFSTRLLTRSSRPAQSRTSSPRLSSSPRKSVVHRRRFIYGSCTLQGLIVPSLYRNMISFPSPFGSKDRILSMRIVVFLVENFRISRFLNGVRLGLEKRGSTVPLLSVDLCCSEPLRHGIYGLL